MDHALLDTISKLDATSATDALKALLHHSATVLQPTSKAHFNNNKRSCTPQNATDKQNLAKSIIATLHTAQTLFAACPDNLNVITRSILADAMSKDQPWLWDLFIRRHMDDLIEHPQSIILLLNALLCQGCYEQAKGLSVLTAHIYHHLNNKKGIPKETNTFMRHVCYAALRCIDTSEHQCIPPQLPAALQLLLLSKKASSAYDMPKTYHHENTEQEKTVQDVAIHRCAELVLILSNAEKLYSTYLHTEQDEMSLDFSKEKETPPAAAAPPAAATMKNTTMTHREKSIEQRHNKQIFDRESMRSMVALIPVLLHALLEYPDEMMAGLLRDAPSAAAMSGTNAATHNTSNTIDYYIACLLFIQWELSWCLLVASPSSKNGHAVSDRCSTASSIVSLTKYSPCILPLQACSSLLQKLIHCTINEPDVSQVPVIHKKSRVFQKTNAPAKKGTTAAPTTLLRLSLPPKIVSHVCELIVRSVVLNHRLTRVAALQDCTVHNSEATLHEQQMKDVLVAATKLRRVLYKGIFNPLDAIHETGLFRGEKDPGQQLHALFASRAGDLTQEGAADLGGSARTKRYYDRRIRRQTSVGRGSGGGLADQSKRRKNVHGSNADTTDLDTRLVEQDNADGVVTGGAGDEDAKEIKVVPDKRDNTAVCADQEAENRANNGVIKELLHQLHLASSDAAALEGEAAEEHRDVEKKVRKRITPQLIIPASPVNQQVTQDAAAHADEDASTTITTTTTTPTLTTTTTTAKADDQNDPLYTTKTGRIIMKSSFFLNEEEREAMWEAYIQDKDIMLKLLDDAAYRTWHDEEKNPRKVSGSKAMNAHTRSIDHAMDAILGGMDSQPAPAESASLMLPSSMASTQHGGQAVISGTTVRMPWQAALAACMQLINACMAQELEDNKGCNHKEFGHSDGCGGTTSVLPPTSGIRAASEDPLAGLLTSTDERMSSATAAVTIFLPHTSKNRWNKASSMASKALLSGSSLHFLIELKRILEHVSGRMSPLLLASYMTLSRSLLLGGGLEEERLLQQTMASSSVYPSYCPSYLVSPVVQKIVQCTHSMYSIINREAAAALPYLLTIRIESIETKGPFNQPLGDDDDTGSTAPYGLVDEKLLGGTRVSSLGDVHYMNISTAEKQIVYLAGCVFMLLRDDAMHAMPMPAWLVTSIPNAQTHCFNTHAIKDAGAKRVAMVESLSLMLEALHVLTMKEMVCASVVPAWFDCCLSILLSILHESKTQQSQKSHDTYAMVYGNGGSAVHKAQDKSHECCMLVGHAISEKIALRFIHHTCKACISCVDAFASLIDQLSSCQQDVDQRQREKELISFAHSVAMSVELIDVLKTAVNQESSLVSLSLSSYQSGADAAALTESIPQLIARYDGAQSSFMEVFKNSSSTSIRWGGRDRRLCDIVKPVLDYAPCLSFPSEAEYGSVSGGKRGVGGMEAIADDADGRAMETRKRKNVHEIKNPYLKAIIQESRQGAVDGGDDDLSDLEDFIVANPERNYGEFIQQHFPTVDDGEWEV